MSDGAQLSFPGFDLSPRGPAFEAAERRTVLAGINDKFDRDLDLGALGDSDLDREPA